VKQYLELAQQIINEGETRGDRTGTGTKSIFGTQTRYDLREGFPLVTSRKINFSPLVKELLWFLRGETNIKTLDCKIWDAWANQGGELGPIYGKQWTSWAMTDGDTVDQIKGLVAQLKGNPESRRHIVSAWNVADVPDMALSPCHTMFQCYASRIPREGSGDRMRYAKDVLGAEDPEVYKRSVRLREAGVPDYYLDLQLYQRSCDFLVGGAFNIASYSLLLMLLAREANMIPRYFIHTIGDAHIYLNQLEGAKEQLSRKPLTLPRVEIADKPMPYPGCPRDGSVLEPEDFKLIGYEPWPGIKYEVAV
jgi:thymidylate synthase